MGAKMGRTAGYSALLDLAVSSCRRDSKGRESACAYSRCLNFVS